MKLSVLLLALVVVGDVLTAHGERRGGGNWPGAARRRCTRPPPRTGSPPLPPLPGPACVLAGSRAHSKAQPGRGGAGRNPGAVSTQPGTTARAAGPSKSAEC